MRSASRHPRKIVYVVPIDFPNLGSRGHRILQMGKAWKQHGYEVEILIPYPATPGGFSNGAYEKAVVDGITLKCAADFKKQSGSKWKRKLSGLTFNRHIDEAINDNAKCFILSQIFDAHLIMAVIRCARRRGVPVICEYMDLLAEPTSLLSKAYWFANELFMKKVYEEADMLWLISECLIEKVKQKAPRAKAMKVPAFATEPDRVDTKAAKGIVPEMVENGRKFVTYAGTFDEHQGVALLIEAFSEVQRIMPGTMLLLAGENKNQELLFLTERLGLRKCVSFLGYVPRDALFEIFRRSNVLVCPKLPGEFSEAGFSTKFVDYLLSGAATVASRLGEQALIAKDNEQAIFFTPGEKDELVRKLIDLLKREDKARRIGEAGRALILSNYDASVVMDKTIDEVEKLLL